MQQLTFESYMNKELVRKQADGARAHLLQGSGAPVRGWRVYEALARRWKPISWRPRRCSVAVLGALMTDLGPVVRQPEAARLEAARLGLRPDLDHDLRAGGGRRRASAGAALRPAPIANDAGAVRAQRLPERVLEPAVFPAAPARLGADRSAVPVAVGAGVDRRCSARYARIAAWLLVPYLVWVTIAPCSTGQTVRLNGPFGAGETRA